MEMNVSVAVRGTINLAAYLKTVVTCAAWAISFSPSVTQRSAAGVDG